MLHRDIVLRDKLEAHASQEFFAFDNLVATQKSFKNLVGICLFLVWMKCLKYLSFNKTMLQFSTTLARVCTSSQCLHFPRILSVTVDLLLTTFALLGFYLCSFPQCARDLFGFGIMFLIVFIAYAQFGYVIFGNDLEAFKSLETSVFTLFRTILGDFNYLEIEQSNRVFGPLYFMSYIFFVFFILLVIYFIFRVSH